LLGGIRSQKRGLKPARREVLDSRKLLILFQPLLILPRIYQMKGMKERGKKH
jgi:hypothetical protein